ncbi:hypothetical protein D3C72_918330 [compost metagenome]
MTSERVARITSRIWSHSIMRALTPSKMPASTARGICAANGASATSTRAIVTPWTTPEARVLAPARMLTAVRAIAPVAGMPPKNGTARLARPWPMSSRLGSWGLAPERRSATVAESSDSIAPSAASAIAGRTSSPRRAGSKGSQDGMGSPCGIAPMRGTSRCNAVATPVRTTRATSEGGIVLLIFGQSHIDTSTPAVRAIAAGLAAAAWRATAASWPSGPPSKGTAARPRPLPSWPMKMITPMPAVNPVMTGIGRSAARRPMRARPSPSWIAPAINPAIQTPSSPYWATMPTSTTAIAPVGPVIWS